MNLDVVSLMKSKLHMKLIIWGIIPEEISIQMDFQDIKTTSRINSRDSDKITLVTNSTETRVVHLQGHNSRCQVSMTEPQRWKRL